MMNPIILIALYAIGGYVVDYCLNKLAWLLLILKYTDEALVYDIICENPFSWDDYEEDCIDELCSGNVLAIIVLGMRYMPWPIRVPMEYYIQCKKVSIRIKSMK